MQVIYMLGRICLSAYSETYFGIYLVEFVRVLVGVTVFWICSVLSFMKLFEGTRQHDWAI